MAAKSKKAEAEAKVAERQEELQERIGALRSAIGEHELGACQREATSHLTERFSHFGPLGSIFQVIFIEQVDERLHAYLRVRPDAEERVHDVYLREMLTELQKLDNELALAKLLSEARQRFHEILTDRLSKKVEQLQRALEEKKALSAAGGGGVPYFPFFGQRWPRY